MMNNTEYLFSVAKDFQDKRCQVMDTFESKMKKLKGFENSLQYKEEKKQAEIQRDNALASLKREASDKMDSAINMMRTKNHERSLPAPTQDQLSLLQTLKMRKSISEDELTQIANSMSDNPICLGVIQEIARANGIQKNYRSLCGNTFSITAADDTINWLVTELRDFVKYDTTASSRHLAMVHENLHGNTNVPLRKRTLFNTEEGFFEEMGLGRDELTALRKATD